LQWLDTWRKQNLKKKKTNSLNAFMFWSIRVTSVNVFDEVKKALRFSEIGLSAQNHLQIDLRIPWPLSVWLDSRAIDNTIQRQLGC
jgi:hypothetical protein